MSVASLQGHVKSMIAFFGASKKSRIVQGSATTTKPVFVSGHTSSADTDESLAIMTISNATSPAAEVALLQCMTDAAHSPEVLGSPRGLGFGHIRADILRSMKIDPAILGTPTTPSTVDGSAAIQSFITQYSATPRSISTACTSLRSTPSPIAPKYTCQGGYDGISRLQFDDFSHLKLLGRGCSAVAHLCLHRATGQLVVLKMLDKLLANEELIMNEQEVLRTVGTSGNPYIAPFLGSFHNAYTYVLVFAYFSRGDLKSKIVIDGALPLPLARFYMAELLLALEDVHKRAIAHRDVKPENIFIGKDGHIALGDFGLAKCLVPKGLLLSPGTENGWYTREVAGTARYMAPETFLGQLSGTSADMYSLGSVALEMLTGRPPWPSEGGQTVADIRNHIVNETVDDYLADQIDLDPTARSFLEKLLDKDSKKRPTVEQAMADEFFKDVNWAAMKQRKVPVPDVQPSRPLLLSEREPLDKYIGFGSGGVYRAEDDPAPAFNYVSPALIAPRDKGIPRLSRHLSRPPSPFISRRACPPPSPPSSPGAVQSESFVLPDNTVPAEPSPLAACSEFSLASLPAKSCRSDEQREDRSLEDGDVFSMSLSTTVSPSRRADRTTSYPSLDADSRKSPSPNSTGQERRMMSAQTTIIATYRPFGVGPLMVFTSSSPPVGLTPIFGPSAPLPRGRHVRFVGDYANVGDHEQDRKQGTAEFSPAPSILVANSSTDVELARNSVFSVMKNWAKKALGGLSKFLVRLRL